MLRFSKYVLEQASLTQLAVGGASLLGSVAAGSLFVRQRVLQQHPLHEAAAAQLTSAPEVHRLFESEAVTIDGFVGGYVDLLGGTAVLNLPLQAPNGHRGYARLEAEAVPVTTDEPASQLGFAHGAGRFRWSLRHLEVTKDRPEPTRPLALYSSPPVKELPSYAPARDPAGPRSVLPRQLQALVPCDLGVMRWVAFHVTCFFLIARWCSRHDRSQRAVTALEALIRLPPEPSLLALRESALRGLTTARTRSMLDAPAKIQVVSDDFYGKAHARELVAYTRVGSPSGTADLLMHATRRGDRDGRWQLLCSSLVDTSEIEAILRDSGEDADAARSSIWALAAREAGGRIGDGVDRS